MSSSEKSQAQRFAAVALVKIRENCWLATIAQKHSKWRPAVKGWKSQTLQACQKPGRGKPLALEEYEGHAITSASTYISLGQEVGAKLKVILELEGAASFELHTKGREGSRLVQILHAASASELPLSVL